MKRRGGEVWEEKTDPHDDPFFFPNRSWHFQLAALTVKFRLTRKLATASQSFSPAFSLRLYTTYNTNRPRGAFPPRLEL